MSERNLRAIAGEPATVSDAGWTRGPWAIVAPERVPSALVITSPYWPKPIAIACSHPDQHYRHRTEVQQDGGSITTFDPPTEDGDRRADEVIFEKVSNAHLIAAGPELAASLAECVNWLAYSTAPSDAPAIEAAVSRARAALAKAKGGTSP